MFFSLRPRFAPVATGPMPALKPALIAVVVGIAPPMAVLTLSTLAAVRWPAAFILAMVLRGQRLPCLGNGLTGSTAAGTRALMSTVPSKAAAEIGSRRRQKQYEQWHERL